MNCDDARLFLTASLDNELDTGDAIRLEQHLGGCAECRGIEQQEMALRSSLQDPGLREQPSPEFVRRIHKSLRAAAARDAHSARGPLSWSAAAIAVAAGVVLAVLLLRYPGTAPLTDEVLDSHLRSLQTGHLVDVPSTDQHTVKPWFQGKLDFSPPVPDLSAQGTPLIGGRLDYFGGQPAAALVYRRGQHDISVFVAPNRGESGSAAFSGIDAKGYHIFHWSDAAVNYWVVSDMNRSALETFAREFRARE